MRNVLDAPAILLIGSDPTYQHPLLAWQIRNNVRLHRSRLYLINARPIKLTRQATHFVPVAGGTEGKAVAFLAGDDSAREHCAVDESGRDKLSALRDKLRTEKDLIIAFGSELRGEDIAMLVRVGAAIPGCKWVCLGDYANSRGAADMGLYPDLLPGYTPLSQGAAFREGWDAEFPTQPGLNFLQMMEAAKGWIAEGAIRCWFEPRSSLPHRPICPAGNLLSRTGPFPYRDGSTGGYRASCNIRLREIGNLHEHLR